MAFQVARHLRGQMLSGCLAQYCLNENTCGLSQLYRFPFSVLMSNTTTVTIFALFCLKFTRYCHTCRFEGVINSIYYLSITYWSCPFTFTWFSIALPPTVWLYNAFLNCQPTAATYVFNTVHSESRFWSTIPSLQEVQWCRKNL